MTKLGVNLEKTNERGKTVLEEITAEDVGAVPDTAEGREDFAASTEFREGVIAVGIGQGWSAGGGGGGTGFQHVQTVPLATWVIPHAFGRLPAVDLYIGGELVDADVTVTPTTVTLTLPAPAVGVAILT